MATVLKPNIKNLVVDKKMIRRVLAEQDAVTGFVEDPDATAQKAQAMALADGVRPEENLLSRGVISARDEQ